jgi:hypothetical protein
MTRREFIGLIGGAAAWPLAARATERRLVGVLWSDRAQAESWGVKKAHDKPNRTVATFLGLSQRLGGAIRNAYAAQCLA